MDSFSLSIFIAGLLFGAGPCLASCGPLLLSYIVGTGKNVPQSIVVYLLFSLGRMSVYVALALAVFFGGQLLAERLLHSSMHLVPFIGGIFITGMGVLMFVAGRSRHERCQKLTQMFLRNDAKTVVGLGLVIGLLPCLPFISLLSYIGVVAKTWRQSIGYSLLFGAGTLFSPLFLLALAAGWFRRMITLERFTRLLNAVCAAMLVFLGVRLIVMKGV